MKYLGLLILFFFIGCRSVNPYYKMYISGLPFLTVFEVKTEHPSYIISGEHNVDKNTFKCQLPDSLGGRNIVGDCVVNIIINNNTGAIKHINLIGMYARNIQQKKTSSFDVYFQGFKRIGKPNAKGFETYISFLSDFVKKLSFERVTQTNTTFSDAYCRIIIISRSE